MNDKIKTATKSSFITSLSDVRNIGMIAFGVVALLVTWSSVKVVQTNYGLQKQLSALQQQNEVSKLANENLKLKNQYYQTDDYLELAARKHFNKAKEGEKLIIVPEEVALARTVDIKRLNTPEDTSKLTEQASGGGAQRNFNAWLDFLFHRQTN